jgi:hypothetical protein
MSHFLFESSDLVLVSVLEGWNLERQVDPIFWEFPQPKDPSSVQLCFFRSLKILRKAVVFQIFYKKNQENVNFWGFLNYIPSCSWLPFNTVHATFWEGWFYFCNSLQNEA